MSEPRYSTFKSLPFIAKIYISSLMIAIIPLSIYIFTISPFKNINLLDFLIFTIVSIIASANPLYITDKGQSRETDSLFLCAAIIIFSPEQVFIIALLTSLIGFPLGGTKLWAFLYNLETPIFIFLASLVYNSLKPGEVLATNFITYLPAIFTAYLTYYLANQLVNTLTYISLFRKEPIMQSIKQSLNGVLLFILPQYPISILMAFSYQIERTTLMLFILPILFFYLNYHYQSKMQQKEQEVVEEKRRIEQDAHDRIYNRLGALAKKAELALDAPEQMKPALTMIKDDLQKSVADLQKIIKGTPVIDEVATEDNYFQKELTQICEAFKQKSDIKLTHSLDKSFLDNIDPQHFWHLQCIIEECLNNIHKHSKAKRASISFKEIDNSLLICISDDGVGISKVQSAKSKVESKKLDERESELGLPGMQDRAQKIGATISLSANNGKGTKVELRLQRLASPRSQ